MHPHESSARLIAIRLRQKKGLNHLMRINRRKNHLSDADRVRAHTIAILHRTMRMGWYIHM